MFEPVSIQILCSYGRYFDLLSVLCKALIKIRKSFEQIVSPIKTKGIDDCAFIIKEKKGNKIVQITKDEAHFFDTQDPSKEMLDAPATFTTNIKIINLSFNEHNKWYVNDGESNYYVTVEDQDFLSAIESNKPFSKGDILRVKIRREQYYIKDENKLKTENFIESVVEHRQPPQSNQGRIFESIRIPTEPEHQSQHDSVTLAKVEKDEVKKVSKRLKRWAKHQSQYNSRILNAFLHLNKNDGKQITKEKIEEHLGNPPWFSSNFAQMKAIADRNHSKVFDVSSGYVTIWPPVEKEVEAYWQQVNHSK